MLAEMFELFSANYFLSFSFQGGMKLFSLISAFRKLFQCALLLSFSFKLQTKLVDQCNYQLVMTLM